MKAREQIGYILFSIGIVILLVQIENIKVVIGMWLFVIGLILTYPNQPKDKQ